MDSAQAKQMLQQVDCHGIPRGYNGGYSELYKYCLESIDKLERIELIVKKELSPLSLDEMSNAEIQIREILEQ